MGKKSASKVDATPVAVVPQSGRKGKRGAENLIEKASAKKQKVERDEAVLANQKVDKKQVKKADSSSSSEEDSDVSDSDGEPKGAAKKMTNPAKNGSVVVKKPKEDTSSDSSDSESDSDVSDEKPAVKNSPIAVKKITAPADSSDSSESESDDDDKKPAAAMKKGASTEADSSEESESDDESSEDEKETKAAAQPKKSEKKPAESSESSDSDESSSDEEDVTKAAPATTAAKGKVESSDDDSSEDSDSEEEPKANKQKAVASKESESSDGSSDDESDEEKDQKTPKKKDPDVEMVDAEKSASTFQKTPKTPATPASTGSKTLFMGNLSFDVEESDVHEFFKDAGKIVDVRFATNHEGQFKGFGHVEFETADAAQKAMELHEQLLRDRPVRLDLARERGAATPNRDNNSFQRGGKPEGQSAFITGFDTELGEDAIRSELQQVFGSCGAITRISIPPDHETGAPKGVAFIDFSDSDGLSAALGLNDTEAAGGCLHVRAAKPRGDSAGRGGGRSGGRFGGRGGPDGGGRFSGRGGRDGGRGGRFGGGRGGRDGGRGGRGTPYKNSVPSGKKTVFSDD